MLPNGEFAFDKSIGTKLFYLKKIFYTSLDLDPAHIFIKKLSVKHRKNVLVFVQSQQKNLRITKAFSEDLKKN